jgi:hypothetical protein
MILQSQTHRCLRDTELPGDVFLCNASRVQGLDCNEQPGRFKFSVKAGSDCRAGLIYPTMST